MSPETLRLNQLPAVISSLLEHPASHKRIGFLSDYAKIYPILGNGQNIRVWHLARHNKQGEICLKSLDKLCSKYPRSLLSFLSANNETGVISDVREISKIAKKHNCLVYIDAVQSFGKTKINLEGWDVDFASFSGHKIGAMKGIGLLYAKKPFAPLMYGGGQEKGLRPGTYNFPAIYSLKLAVQDIDFQKWENVRKLKNYFENSLLCEKGYEKEEIHNLSNSKTSSPYKRIEEDYPNLSPFKVNCREAHRLPNTTSLYCGPGISNQVVLMFLAQKGICVSTGSACNAGSPEPSHVLTAIADLEDLGDPRAYANSCIRVSFSPSNTKQEVDFLIKSLKEIVSSSCHLSQFSKEPESRL